MYGRCYCQLYLILYHQSAVINWWLVVVLLPLLGLADVIAKVVADVMPLMFYFGRCCANYCCTIDIFVAEGIIVPVADVIATTDFDLADVIAKADVVARWPIFATFMYSWYWWLM